MEEVRIQSALAELNAIIQFLMQRSINHAGDLAVAHKELTQLKEMQNEKTDSAS